MWLSFFFLSFLEISSVKTFVLANRLQTGNRHFMFAVPCLFDFFPLVVIALILRSVFNAPIYMPGFLRLLPNTSCNSNVKNYFFFILQKRRRMGEKRALKSLKNEPKTPTSLQTPSTDENIDWNPVLLFSRSCIGSPTFECPTQEVICSPSILSLQHLVPLSKKRMLRSSPLSL